MDDFQIKLELSKLENKILELENKQNGVKFNVAILQQSLGKLLISLAKNLELWYANTNTNTEKDEDEQTDKSKCH